MEKFANEEEMLSEEDNALNEELCSLITSIAQGNADAVTEVYRKAGRTMHAVARKYFRDRRDVEDVIQDSLLKIVEKAESFRYGKNACAWINMIVRNTALDIHRARQAHGPLEFLDNDTDHSYPFDENSLLVKEILAQLNDDEYDLFVYRFWYKMSLNQLGKLYDMKKSTVKYRLDAVIERLRKFYEK